jgi:hypothetical protein
LSLLSLSNPIKDFGLPRNTVRQPVLMAMRRAGHWDGFPHLTIDLNLPVTGCRDVALN